MSGGRGLCRGHGNLSRVPVLHVTGGLQLAHTVRILRATLSEPLLNARQIVLVVVHHQHRFAVGGLDEILQCVQLAVMKHAHIVELVINCAVRQLKQFACQ